MVSFAQRLLNLGLFLAGWLPAAWVTQVALDAAKQGTCDSLFGPPWLKQQACRICAEDPMIWICTMIFANYVVLYWAVGAVQRSTWLMEAHWCLGPLLTVAYLRMFPSDQEPVPGAPLRQPPLSTRAFFVDTILWTWAARLTHNYLRREQYDLGAREDWRFANVHHAISAAVASACGRLRRRLLASGLPRALRAVVNRATWAAARLLSSRATVSFWVSYLPHLPLVAALCLPIVPLHFSAVQPPAWTRVDTAAAAVCSTGLLLAWVADDALHRFVAANKRTVARGEGALDEYILSTGVWSLCRHPNHLGEQVFWWGVAAWGAYANASWWPLAGAALNSLLMAKVSSMVEERMRAGPRAALFAAYAAHVPCVVPSPLHLLRWLSGHVRPRESIRRALTEQREKLRDDLHGAEPSGWEEASRHPGQVVFEGGESVSSQDDYYMSLAVHSARAGLRAGHGGPFGACVVDAAGEVLAVAHNSVLRDGDPTCHAEIEAVRRACRTQGRTATRGAVLYSTAEPCPMCMAAICWAGVKEVVFGVDRHVAGAGGFPSDWLYEELALPADQRRVPARGGTLHASCAELFDEWQRGSHTRYV
ncbi:unnamed protein product [Pedinophyceae sp. YPF-701]|nr:unnamed protein product [Pedinophyceae sp. YPF-701]